MALLDDLIMRRGPRPASITGLGPHGEFAATAEHLQVSDQNVVKAKMAGYAVGMILHTTRSDWSKLQIAGVTETLEKFNASVIEVHGCDFQADKQVQAIESLIERGADAIISIPVDNALTADAHRRVSQAGIKLVLMDNAPVGMLPGKDYVSLVSADNFGNGQVAADILSQFVREGGSVGIIGFAVDFYVTNEREIAFRKWMKEQRPDVALKHIEFTDVDEAGVVAIEFVIANQEIDGLFVVWDEPAIHVTNALREAGQLIPTTTIDLGNDAAAEIASGGPIKGVGAQQPYDQGVAEALVAIMALVGDEPPPWIALPGLSVTRANVLEAYETVWHVRPPGELRSKVESTK